MSVHVAAVPPSSQTIGATMAVGLTILSRSNGESCGTSRVSAAPPGTSGMEPRQGNERLPGLFLFWIVSADDWRCRPQ